MLNHLTLPYPPSANRSWRMMKGRTVLAPEVRAYRKEVAAIAQHIKPLSGDVEITIDVYRPRKAGDLDNRAKQAIDSLIGIAFHDDKQIVKFTACRYDDKANPRVEFGWQLFGD